MSLVALGTNHLPTEPYTRMQLCSIRARRLGTNPKANVYVDSKSCGVLHKRQDTLSTVRKSAALNRRTVLDALSVYWDELQSIDTEDEASSARSRLEVAMPRIEHTQLDWN
eukprot:4044425-Prymnesium_polylepis.1